MLLVSVLGAASPFRLRLKLVIAPQSIKPRFINGYVQSSMLLDGLDEYILPPVLGNHSGGLGAIAMAIALAPELR